MEVDSIYSTLSFKFKGEAELKKFMNLVAKAQEQSKKLAKQQEGLFSKIGSSGVNALKSLNGAFNEVAKDVVKFTGIVIGASYGFNKMLAGVSNTVQEMHNFENTTGLSSQKMLEFQKAAMLTNVSVTAQEATSSIAGLQKSLMNIKMGTGDASGFLRLGINPLEAQDAFDLLNKVKQKITTIKPEFRSNLMEQVGLSPKFLDYLTTADSELARLGKRRIINQKQQQDIMNITKSLKAMQIQVKSLFEIGFAKGSVKMQESLKRISETIEKNSEMIVNAFSKMIAIGTRFFEAISNAASLVYNFISSLDGVQTKLLAIAGAFTGFKVLTAIFSPITLAIAGIVALLDDIYVWSQGGESLFGNFYDGVATMVNKIKDLFKDLFDFLKALADPFIETFNIISDALYYFNNGVEKGGHSISPQESSRIINEYLPQQVQKSMANEAISNQYSSAQNSSVFNVSVNVSNPEQASSFVNNLDSKQMTRNAVYAQNNP